MRSSVSKRGCCGRCAIMIRSNSFSSIDLVGKNASCHGHRSRAMRTVADCGAMRCRLGHDGASRETHRSPFSPAMCAIKPQRPS
jgi:hypothetical protein